jgi:hypothetical protein
MVGDQRLDWEVFTVPTWTFCEHVNSGDRPAVAAMPPPVAAIEIGFDQGEVGSRLIGLAQREDVLVRYMHVMPEQGCSFLSTDRKARIGRRRGKRILDLY